MAVGAVPGPVFTAVEIILWSPLDVVGNNEIEPAVPVVVEPASARGPSTLVGDAGFGCDVGKSSVPVVVVKDGAAIASHIQIGVAVIVEVPDGDTLTVVAF